jgi:hypothetical protein
LDVPEYLDLQPFVDSAVVQQTKQQMQASSESSESGLPYELYAILMHNGGAAGGHFFAYIKVVKPIFFLVLPPCEYFIFLIFTHQTHTQCFLMGLFRCFLFLFL